MDTTNTAMNPFKAPIDMRRLRIDLFGADRIPMKAEVGPVSTPMLTYGYWKTAPIGVFYYRIIPSTSTGTRSRRGRNHRIQVCCPACNKWIPAGRANQHGRVHVTTMTTTPAMQAEVDRTI